MIIREKTLKEVLNKKNKILLIGNYQSGKTTFLQSVITYCFHNDKEKLILPTLDVKNIKSIFKSSKWKIYSKLYKLNLSSITILGHKQKKETYQEFYKDFSKHFNVIIDARRLKSGKRVLYSIMKKRGKSFYPLYQYPKQEKVSYKKAA